MKTTEKRFVMINHEMLFDSDLSGTDIRVWMVMRSFADMRMTCFPSIAKICERAHVSRNTLRKSIKKLIALGYVISIERKDPQYPGINISNLYHLSTVRSKSISGEGEESAPAMSENEPPPKLGPAGSQNGAGTITNELEEAVSMERNGNKEYMDYFKNQYSGSVSDETEPRTHSCKDDLSWLFTPSKTAEDEPLVAVTSASGSASAGGVFSKQPAGEYPSDDFRAIFERHCSQATQSYAWKRSL